MEIISFLSNRQKLPIISMITDNSYSHRSTKFFLFLIYKINQKSISIFRKKIYLRIIKQISNIHKVSREIQNVQLTKRVPLV